MRTDLLNDDQPPIDRELAYLRDRVEDYLGGAWDLAGDEEDFITQAEAALQEINRFGPVTGATVARHAVIGALVARARRGDVPPHPERERDFLLRIVEREARRAPPGREGIDVCRAALDAARRACLSGDRHGVEDELLVAAGAAIAAGVSVRRH